MSGFFEKFIFELEAFSYIRMGLIQSGKAVDVILEIVLYFNFWVSYLYNINPLPLL